MTIDTKDYLQTAKRYLDAAIQDLETAPEKTALVDLLRAIRSIDNYYKDWCDEIDEENNDTQGTTYEEGVSMEFYIEADWWHDVSVALRKLDK
jgi:hypothetical protein